jgi:gluconolactonase
MEITRRSILVGAAVAAGATHSTAAEWAPNPHYPDPSITVLDPSFAKYRPTVVGIERLAAGLAWSEGPLWFGDGRCLIWSDIPNNRLMRWDEATGAVGVFRNPSNQANGNTRDRQGRLISCEHRTRRLTRTEYNGDVTVLADRFEGKRLNSPNDVVVKSDDSIWFTDPSYGILNNYLASVGDQELPTNVYRLDRTGRLTVVAEGIKMPDGLAFSSDEKTLYIVEDASVPPAIRAYDVVDDGTRLAILRGNTNELRWRWSRWRYDLQQGWSAYRAHRPAGALCQCLLQRLSQEPLVYGGEPTALCGVGEHIRRARRVMAVGATAARIAHRGAS